MFWCYQCSKLIPPTAQLACPVCHSQAIEELNEGIDPVIFLLERREEQARASQTAASTQRPTAASHSQQSLPQAQARVRINFTDLMDHFVGNRMAMMMPSFTFVTFIDLSQVEEKSSVTNQDIDALRKVTNLSSDCAICQEKGEKGLMLPCKHQFHDDCIRTWLKQKNSCPCCRTPAVARV